MYLYLLSQIFFLIFVIRITQFKCAYAISFKMYFLCSILFEFFFSLWTLLLVSFELLKIWLGMWFFIERSSVAFLLCGIRQLSHFLFLQSFPLLPAQFRLLTLSEGPSQYTPLQSGHHAGVSSFLIGVIFIPKSLYIIFRHPRVAIEIDFTTCHHHTLYQFPAHLL